MKKEKDVLIDETKELVTHENEFENSLQKGLHQDEETLSVLPNTKKGLKEPEINNKDVIVLDIYEEKEEEKDLKKIAWNKILRTYNTRGTLTANIVGIETTENLDSMLVVAYLDGIQRILIPASEMGLPPIDNNLSDDEKRKMTSRRLNSMLNAEIDFVIKGIDFDEQIVIGSRKEAMARKRRRFYLSENPLITKNSVAESRIIVVIDNKGIRVEIFGVETFIHLGDVSSEWIYDIRSKYSVGDVVKVRVSEISILSTDEVQVMAEMVSLETDNKEELLNEIKLQQMYIGEVVSVRNEIIRVKLPNGLVVTADKGKVRQNIVRNSTVSLIITRVNKDRLFANGLITRVIKNA